MRVTPTELSTEVGTLILFQDDSVRVWLLDLAPDAATHWHRHECAYAYVVTRAGPVRTEYIDGSFEDQDDRVGQLVHRLPDTGHRLVNRGTEPYQNIVVEFLGQQ